MITVGHVKPNPDWQMPAHFHHFHELIVVFGGQIEVDIAGQILTGRAGDVLFYPQGVRHEETSNPRDPVETYFAAFVDEDLGTPLDLPARSHGLGWPHSHADPLAPRRQQPWRPTRASHPSHLPLGHSG